MINRLDQVIDWIGKNVNRRGAKLCNCVYGGEYRECKAPPACRKSVYWHGCWKRSMVFCGVVAWRI
jgi:hypothetical protein